MFGFSWGEIILISIIALIAIGPKELPNVLRELGRFMGRMRKMADDLRGAFDQLARESDVAEIRRIGLENRPRPAAESPIVTQNSSLRLEASPPPVLRAAGQSQPDTATPRPDDDNHIPPPP